MPTINYLTRIEFDFGAVAALGAEIKRMGLTRPLLVTDRGIADTAILQRVLDAAAPSRPVLYDDTTENPTEQSLMECLKIWHGKGCDGVIALGGGSPIDLAKAVALLPAIAEKAARDHLSATNPRAADYLAILRGAM